MSLRKKIFKKVKRIVGRESSRAEHPLRNEVSPDVLIAPGQPPGAALGEGNRRGIRTTRDESTGSGGISIASTRTRPDRESIMGNAENTVTDNRLGALDPVRPNLDRQHPRDRLDVDSIEEANENFGVHLSTFDSRKHSAAADNNKDGELLVASGRPPIAHCSSESMRFDGVTNSGISMGGGTVNVSNIFHNNPSERTRPGLKLLQKRVATSAFHNSAQRVDPPRCHPNTRVAIQKQIYDWIVLDLLIRQTWIMWMHGAAGAGKSAIMQSIAERCEEAQIPVASFFFFRTDPTRNSMTPFIATLVYQLIQTIPQVQEEILGIIESNPLIFDQSLKSQLEKLIIQPLLRLQKHIKSFFVVLIDGLDECVERAHQADLVKLLGTISRSKAISVLFLIASRREPQIEAAFVDEPVSTLLVTISLDNSDIEQTSDDIQHFLTDKFNVIKKTHLRKHLLSADWPPVLAVEEIVTTSSGQFIYASVVINYVSSPRGNPAHSLDIVRKIRLRDPSSQNPFAHLDALYQYIFSQVEALDNVLELLAYILITDEFKTTFIEGVFLLEKGGLEVSFADLTAVIEVKPEEMYFLHASLPDFLKDKTRSERCHIDVDEYRTKLLCKLLDRIPPILDSPLQPRDRDMIEYQARCHVVAIRELLASGAKESDQLRRSFMTFRAVFFQENFEHYLAHIMVRILTDLKQLNFDDQSQAYHHVLDLFAAGLTENWASVEKGDKSEVMNTPDLRARINQILQEKL